MSNRRPLALAAFLAFLPFGAGCQTTRQALVTSGISTMVAFGGYAMATSAPPARSDVFLSPQQAGGGALAVAGGTVALISLVAAVVMATDAYGTELDRDDTKRTILTTYARVEGH